MAKSTNTDSTAKLLNLIRGHDKKSQANATSGSAAPGFKPVSKAGFARFLKRRNVIVGVDIGAKDLRLARIARSDNSPKLLGIAQIGIPGHLDRQAPEFADFLGKCLKEFCGSARNVEIWGQISSLDVEVWHMRIPKVKASQISATVLWSARKEKSIDDKRDIFDFEIQGEVMDKGVAKYTVMAYTFPRKDTEDLKELLTAAGYPPTGITIASFAILNMFRTGWLPDTPATSASLFIGRNWSRIDVIANGGLTLTRGVLTGTHSFVESMITAYNEALDRQTETPDTPKAPPYSAESGYDLKTDIFTNHAEEQVADHQIHLVDGSDWSDIPLTLETPEESDIRRQGGSPMPSATASPDFVTLGVGDRPSHEAITIELNTPDEPPTDSQPWDAPPVHGRDDQDPFAILDNGRSGDRSERHPDPDGSAGIFRDYSAEPDGQTIRAENHGPRKLSLEDGEKCLFCRLSDTPEVKAEDPAPDLSDEELFDLTSQAVDRLVRQIERTFEHYTLTLGHDRVERLYISGLLGTFRPLLSYLEAQLGLKPRVIDPLSPDIRHLGSVIPSSSVSDRLAFAPAIGLALSANSYTPNFIHTYADKLKEEKSKLASRGILGAFLALSLVGASYHGWQYYALDAKAKELSSLKSRIMAKSPLLEATTIQQKMAEIMKAGQSIGEVTRRKVPLGLVNELAALTPDAVRLTSMNLLLGEGQGKDGRSGSQVTLEGLVFGPQESQQTSLFNLIYQLKNSKLLANPVLQTQKEEVMADGKTTLRFTISLELK